MKLNVKKTWPAFELGSLNSLSELLLNYPHFVPAKHTLLVKTDVMFSFKDISLTNNYQVCVPIPTTYPGNITKVLDGCLDTW